MIYLIEFTFSTMPLLMCYLSASIVISTYLLIKSLCYVGRANGINFYSSKGGNIVWSILEKSVGRVSVIVWALSIFNIMIDISMGAHSGSISVEPFDLLYTVDVIAMAVTGIMASAAYFLCFLAELVNKVIARAQ